MKLIIDISEEAKRHIDTFKGKFLCGDGCDMISAIQNGTPIPDNATNGNILKTIIPMENYYGDERAIQFYHYIEWDFPKWWNAPYQKGGKE